MSRIRLAILALAIATPITAAQAETVQVSSASVAPKVGEVLRDAAGRRIGNVESVRADQGVVTVIVDMRLFRVPISTLSTGAKGLQTSLKRADLR